MFYRIVSHTHTHTALCWSLLLYQDIYHHSHIRSYKDSFKVLFITWCVSFIRLFVYLFSFFLKQGKKNLTGVKHISKPTLTCFTFLFLLLSLTLKSSFNTHQTRNSSFIPFFSTRGSASGLGYESLYIYDLWYYKLKYWFVWVSGNEWLLNNKDRCEREIL